MDRMLRWGALTLAWVAAATSRAAAQADVERIAVVRTGLEPACAEIEAIAAAIARHAGLPAQVADPHAPLPGVLDVRIYGEPEQFQVKLAGAATAVRVFTEGAPCTSIPDVVAAFVATVAVPAPELAPPPPLEATRPADDDVLPGKIRSERALVLFQSIDSSSFLRKSIGRGVAAGVVVGMGAVAFANIGGVLNRSLVVGGAATTLITAGLWIANPRSAGADVAAEAGWLAGMGLVMLGTALDVSSTDATIYASAVMTSAAWMAIDQAVAPPVSFATLHDLRARLRTPQQRAALSETELARAERTFRRSGERMRYWIPVVLGSLIILARAATEEDPDRRAFGLQLGLTMPIVVAASPLFPTPLRRYRKRLREAGLDMYVAGAPGGATVALGGRF